MRIPVQSGELACQSIGSGQPIIFIHGFPITGLMWLHAARHLPPGFRGIVPDLPNHGASTTRSPIDIRDFADDMLTVLDVFAPGEQGIFIGLSMGGIICFDLWRRYPGRIRALVLCNTRANAEPPEGIAYRRAIADSAMRDGVAPIVEAMLPKVFAPGFDQARLAFWRTAMLSTTPTGLAATSLALASRADSFPTVPTITCPTLVIAGDQDAITSPDSLHDIHQRIPGSRFTVIPDAGHVPPVEQPVAFSAALNEFLTKLPA
ncbi:MAG: alpha/beta fold hydrolase [Phycisphaerales bacterium]|nr:alpha/beta fold hydrolase [Phycisphaerales bacterium]